VSSRWFAATDPSRGRLARGALRFAATDCDDRPARRRDYDDDDDNR
jgi:hypothetical protein